MTAILIMVRPQHRSIHSHRTSGRIILNLCQFPVIVYKIIIITTFHQKHVQAFVRWCSGLDCTGNRETILCVDNLCTILTDSDVSNYFCLLIAKMYNAKSCVRINSCLIFNLHLYRCLRLDLLLILINNLNIKEPCERNLIRILQTKLFCRVIQISLILYRPSLNLPDLQIRPIRNASFIIINHRDSIGLPGRTDIILLNLRICHLNHELLSILHGNSQAFLCIECL